MIPDSQRREIQLKQRQIVSDNWEDMLGAFIRRHIGAERAQKWGFKDTTWNISKTLTETLAVRYIVAPTVKGDSKFIDILNQSNLWGLMPRVERNTYAIREMLMHIDANVSGKLIFRPVFPNDVEVELQPDDPSEIWLVRENRVWIKDGKEIEVVITHDVRDPINPVFSVKSKNGKDFTKQFINDENWVYPWVYSNGIPFVPYVLRHAEDTGQLWDSTTANQLIQLSLMCGMMYSFFAHSLMRASWPQRWGMNVELVGEEFDAIDAETNQPYVAEKAIDYDTDPGSFVILRRSGDSNEQSEIGQWQSASNPQDYILAIKHYAQQALSIVGMSAANIVRNSSDMRSGVALHVDRETQRDAQRKTESSCRSADLQMISKAAAIYNSQYGTKFKESGYKIEYHSIPPSKEEQDALHEKVKFRLENKLISRAEALNLLIPDKSIEDCVKAINDLDSLEQKGMEKVNGTRAESTTESATTASDTESTD